MSIFPAPARGPPGKTLTMFWRLCARGTDAERNGGLLRGSGMSFTVLSLLVLATGTMNVGFGGSIASRTNLARELTISRSVPEPHYAVPPFKYRVLFRLLVDSLSGPASLVWGPPGPGEAVSMAAVSVTSLPSRALYAAWLLASAAAFLTALLAFKDLLLELGFTEPWAFLGSILWLLSPPAFFAYIFPVHTRDDMLAHLFLVLGVRGILAGRYGVVVACTVLGVLTRETLMILPVACFFWRPFRWGRCLSLLGLGAAIFLATRLVLGWELYDALEEGVAYNLRWPLEAVTGLWLVFGVVWCPAALAFLSWVVWRRSGALDGWCSPADTGAAEIRARWAFVYASIVPVSLVMLGMHTVLGRLRETRISFHLAPWIIAVGLAFIQQVGARSGRDRAPVRHNLVCQGSLVWGAVTLSVVALQRLGHAYWRLGEFRDSPWLGLIIVHGLVAAGFVAWWWYVVKGSR